MSETKLEKSFYLKAAVKKTNIVSRFELLISSILTRLLKKITFLKSKDKVYLMPNQMHVEQNKINHSTEKKNSRSGIAYNLNNLPSMFPSTLITYKTKTSQQQQWLLCSQTKIGNAYHHTTKSLSSNGNSYLLLRWTSKSIYGGAP